MSTPAANKRRRVDAANAILRKPFQSPVIRRPDAAGTGEGSNQTTPDQRKTSTADDEEETAAFSPTYSPSSPSTMSPAAKKPRLQVRPTKSLSSLHRPPTSPIKRQQQQPAFQTPLPGAAKRKGVEAEAAVEVVDEPGSDILALVQTHRRRHHTAPAEAKELDRQIDVARQARRIEEAAAAANDAVDGELRALVERWKGAARMAAEELFESARERVENAGGARAWAGMRRRQRMGWRGDEEEKVGGCEEGAAGSDDDGDGGDDESDELEFNMAQMLRSLNIDLDLLGYDEAEERWID